MKGANRAFRLLPSERVLWEGHPEAGVPRGWVWVYVPLLLVALGTITALFAGLLAAVELPGASQVASVAAYFGLFAGAVRLAPVFLHDRCEFLITDRRVLWQRGRIHRSIDHRALTYARVLWNPTVPTVGHLELVRAVPFGPLHRKQRLVLHDIAAPDEVLAIIRGVEANPHCGDRTTPMIDRLDTDEDVLWAAVPEGFGVDWRHIMTSVFGLLVLFVGLPTGLQSAAVLARLEELGLRTGSGIWLLLFVAVGLTATVILSVGVGLSWHGILRAHAMGNDTEYLLTDRRLLIRRGRVELSIDRSRIVDVAPTPGFRGLTNLYLVLDGPEARALADSGALSVIAPSRDLVPPVLYELRDPSDLCTLLMGRSSRPSMPHAA